MSEWNEQDHPRKRAGSAGGHGGEFEDKPSVGDDMDLTDDFDFDLYALPPLPDALRGLWAHPGRVRVVSIRHGEEGAYLTPPDADHDPVLPEGYRYLNIHTTTDGDVVLSGEEPLRHGPKIVVEDGFEECRLRPDEFRVLDGTLADELAQWDELVNAPDDGADETIAELGEAGAWFGE